MPETVDSSDSDRRRHPRVMASFQVRSRPLGPTEVGTLLKGLGESNPVIPSVGMKRTNAGTWNMVSTNISTGGISASGDLQVTGNDPMVKGTDLMVEMEMNDGKEPLRAIAQVMWCTSVSQGSYLAGMMFVVISEENLERIRHYVVEAIQDEKLVP